MATQPHITEDVDLARLQSIYDRLLSDNLPATDFAKAIESIDWYSKNPEAFDDAIQMALELSATRSAGWLAKRGHELHPESETLARAYRLFKPPVPSWTGKRGSSGVGASMEWLEQHRFEYSGLWVALKNGELIGTASERDELVAQIGSFTEDDNILITRMG